MPKRERRRDERLTRKAVRLWGAGLNTNEIADALRTTPEVAERLLKPLGVSGRAREEQFEPRQERQVEDMTESSEPIRTFEKRLPSLGPDAPPVAFTELADGTYIVDFVEAHEEPIRELGQRHGYGDLTADLPWVGGGFQSVDLSEEAAAADLAIKPGDFVQWSFGGTDAVAFGQVVSVNEEAGEAVIKPMSLDDNGNLVDTGARKTTVSLSILVASDKKPAEATGWPNETKQVTPNLSDEELYRSWAELAGLDAEEGVASLSEDMPAEDATQTQVAEAADLRHELRRQSIERDDGPSLDEPESRGLLSIWRRLFRGEEG